MSEIPAEIRKIAEDAAKAELADCENCRQFGRHVGSVVLQAVWPYLLALKIPAPGGES